MASSGRVSDVYGFKYDLILPVCLLQLILIKTQTCTCVLLSAFHSLMFPESRTLLLAKMNRYDVDIFEIRIYIYIFFVSHDGVAKQI